MEWIFALGITFMAAVNRPFRRVVFWTFGAAAILFALVGLWALSPLK